VSYLNVGIGRLTNQIYVSLEDARQTRRVTQQMVRNYVGDDERMQGAVSAMDHAASFAQGLIRAWELVTGEIWGEAAWQPSTRT
jgi:hypothetical protein